jgi:hypothetical protein
MLAGAASTVGGIVAGAATFSIASAALVTATDRKRCGECKPQPSEADAPGSGTSIALGTALDAVPEALILGVTLRAARLRPSRLVPCSYDVLVHRLAVDVAQPHRSKRFSKLDPVSHTKGDSGEGPSVGNPGSGVSPAGARVSADMPRCATSFTIGRKTERDGLEPRQDRRDTGTNTLSWVAFQLLNRADAGSYAALCCTRGEVVQ